MDDYTGGTACGCRTSAAFVYTLFPAYFRKRETPEAEQVVDQDEAACYNHPNKKATAACDSCGMFACPLCLMVEGDQQVCLNCFSRKTQPQGKQNKGQTENRRVVFDSIALAIVLYPWLLLTVTGWLTIVTAPMAVYIVIAHWKKHPCSIITPRSRVRYYLAFVFALLTIVGWGMLFAAMVTDTYNV